MVRNITYDGMTVISDDCEYLDNFQWFEIGGDIVTDFRFEDSIELTSCYMQTTANCNKYPVSPPYRLLFSSFSLKLPILFLACKRVNRLSPHIDKNDNPRRRLQEFRWTSEQET